MINLLDLAPAAIKLTPNFHSANNLGPNINSYNQYYQQRLLSNINFQQQTNEHQHRAGRKHKMHSTSRQKKHQSRVSADQQSLLSKNRAKSSQTHGSKSHSHKSQVKRKYNQIPNKKSPKQDYKVAQQYLSRVSQMGSEISVPSHTVKINLKQLNELENRIMSEILQLREEKISALEELNGIVDGKNRAVEILRKLEVMREVERVNEGEMVEEQQGKNEVMNEVDNSSSLSKVSYLQGRTPLNRLIKSPTPTRGNHAISSSRLSQSPAHQHSHQAQMINSKLSQQMQQKDETVAEVKRIKQELMKPLLNQHPLLMKNSQLKHELQQLQQQIVAIKQSPKQNLQSQIEHYNQQNLLIKKQIERQQQKLTSLESKRFATFFPKDRENVQRMRKLMEMERELEDRKEKLLDEQRVGGEERSKEEEGIVAQLREQNRQLQVSCEQLLSQQQSATYSTAFTESSAMPIQQLQSLVYRQQQSKHTLSHLLTQFRVTLMQLEEENNRLRQRQQNSGYYNRQSYNHNRWSSQPYYNPNSSGYYNSSNYNYNSPKTNDNNSRYSNYYNYYY